MGIGTLRRHYEPAGAFLTKNSPQALKNAANTPASDFKAQHGALKSKSTKHPHKENNPPRQRRATP